MLLNLLKQHVDGPVQEKYLRYHLVYVLYILQEEIEQ